MVSLQELLMLFGGATAVVCGVIIYVANRFSDKLNISWKKQADVEISHLQGDIDKNNNAISELVSMYGDSYGQAQDRRIKAIEILWAKLMELENLIPPPIHAIFNVLTEEEVKNFWTESTDNIFYTRFRTLLREFDFHHHFAVYSKTFDQIKMERPFLGERIWTIAEVLVVFTARIAHFAQEGTEKQMFKHWHHDQMLQDLFRKTLKESEYEYIYSKEGESLKLTQALLENKLIEEIEKVLSGTHTTESALDRLKTFETALKLRK